MKPKIEIYPKGGSTVKPLIETIIKMQPDFNEAGIDIEIVDIKTFDPICSLIITIIGTISSHYIIKLVDQLISAKKNKTENNVQITIFVNEKPYSIPNERTKLFNFLKEKESPNSISS